MGHLSGFDANRSISARGAAIRQLRWAARPSFATGSLAEAQQHLRAFEQSTMLGIPQPRAFGGYSESYVRLGGIAISMTSIASEAGYELRFRPREHYCLNVPLNGSGWVINGAKSIELHCGQAALVTPSCEVLKHWHGPSQVLTLHIPANMLDDDVLLPCLPPISIIDCDGLNALLDLIGTVCGSAGDENSPLLHPSVTEHLERAVLSLLNRLLPRKPDGILSPKKSPARPYYLRRAERYMRANFCARVTLADIAEAAGVSPRSVQYGFKQYHDTTPLLFFKQLRLEYARDLLSDGFSGKSMSELAWDLGYQSASHFSHDYRLMFGEAPSSTAARQAPSPKARLQHADAGRY